MPKQIQTVSNLLRAHKLNYTKSFLPQHWLIKSLKAYFLTQPLNVSHSCTHGHSTP